MLAEWTAECAHDAPTLVVPWMDAASGVRFVDLRERPYDIADIIEAERFPPLGRALRALNATRSPFLTAKCDAWPLPSADREDELENLRLELDLGPEEARYGFASYIDLLWRERVVFASAHQQTDRLDRIVRRAQKLQHPEASLQFVLRPALFDLGTPLEGFAATCYITALGPDLDMAAARWAAGLEDVVALLRHRDLEPSRGSATIGS